MNRVLLEFLFTEIVFGTVNVKQFIKRYWCNYSKAALEAQSHKREVCSSKLCRNWRKWFIQVMNSSILIAIFK